MTILYKPVLIESAEQAEALPAGTLLVDIDERGYRHGYRAVADPADLRDHHWALNDHFLGWTALVPIEVEEGTDTIQAGAGHFYIRSRFVTPWEEA